MDKTPRHHQHNGGEDREESILSAPAKSPEVSTMVHRVNTTNGPTTGIISCASCTTNCIAPVVEDMGR